MKCMQYFATSRRWVRLRNMPTVRMDAASVQTDNTIFVIGGMTFNKKKWKPTKCCENFSFENGQWVKQSPMPTNLMPKVVAIQNCIYMVYYDHPLYANSDKKKKRCMYLFNLTKRKWQKR